jgi:translin
MPDELDLNALEAEVRAELDAKYTARELTLKNSRPIIRNSANAIRALHRGDVDGARELLAEVRVLIAEAEASIDGHWDTYHAGFF